MSGKQWGLGVALTALLGIVYFFGPVLLILVASLLEAGSGRGAHSENIGSGQNLNVRKIVTPHRSWDTGSAFEVIAYDVLFKGKKVSREKLGKLLGLENFATENSALIYDAVELQADDFLLILTKGSQEVAYAMARVRVDAATSALRAEVVKLGGEDSAYQWFPGSRLPGWSRAVSSKGEQFMIRHTPFQMVSLGRGALAKVEFPYAFLATDENNSPRIEFRAVNLNDGKTAASLKLDKYCFSWPRFSFDWKPGVVIANPGDRKIEFSDGPAWWDKHIDWDGQSAALRLRSADMLKEPCGKP